VIDLPNKLSAEDRLDIQELFARYAWALDLGDPEGVVACFTEDCLFDHLWQGHVQGRENIMRALSELWYDRPSWWVGRQHLATHFLLERVDERTARARAFFSILQFNVYYRTNSVFGIGTWDNVCVKRDGIWLFKELHVNAWREADEIPWQGDRRAWEVPRAEPSAPAELPG
jgi:3-phenylpropionate/cinnamic acid dioxygenase small subunit